MSKSDDRDDRVIMIEIMMMIDDDDYYYYYYRNMIPITVGLMMIMIKIKTKMGTMIFR